MSSLLQYNLDEIIRDYRITALVETGLNDGRSIKHALDFEGLEVLVSIEIVGCKVEAFKRRGYVDPRLTLIHGDSSEEIGKAVGLVEGHQALWWLDAHCPDRYGAEGTTYPLQAELETILKREKWELDVFIVDDVGLYQSDLPRWTKFREEHGDPGNFGFALDSLGNTHNFFFRPAGDGVAIMPRRRYKELWG